MVNMNFIIHWKVFGVLRPNNYYNINKVIFSQGNLGMTQ